jgi:peptidyl-prolyl cis-trans isomerase C
MLRHPADSSQRKIFTLHSQIPHLMKKLSFAVCSLTLVLAAALPLSALAQNITTVNGKPVPKAKLDILLKKALKPGQPRTPEIETQAQDYLVMQEILEQEAVKRGIATSDDYKAEIEMMRQKLLIQQLIAEEQKKSAPTDAEIATEYDKYKKQVSGNEYRSHHILVDKESEAKSILAQLSKGSAKFEDLAKKNSKDPGSKEKGGDLDWADPASYDPVFSAALLKLKKGETTSAAVKSNYGYHIIRLDDTRPAQPQPLEQLKPQISQQLIQTKMKAFIDDLRAKAKTDYKFAPTPGAPG